MSEMLHPGDLREQGDPTEALKNMDQWGRGVFVVVNHKKGVMCSLTFVCLMIGNTS